MHCRVHLTFVNIQFSEVKITSRYVSVLWQTYFPVEQHIEQFSACTDLQKLYFFTLKKISCFIVVVYNMLQVLFLFIYFSNFLHIEKWYLVQRPKLHFTWVSPERLVSSPVNTQFKVIDKGKSQIDYRVRKPLLTETNEEFVMLGIQQYELRNYHKNCLTIH